jgi:hypothetical protein
METVLNKNMAIISDTVHCLEFLKQNISKRGSISVTWCNRGKVPTQLCLSERVGLHNVFEKTQDDGQCSK